MSTRMTETLPRQVKMDAVGSLGLPLVFKIDNSQACMMVCRCNEVSESSGSRITYCYAAKGKQAGHW